MKKYFSLLMSAVILLLASCTQDDLSNLPLGQEMNTKVSMQLPPMKRAAHEDPNVDADNQLRVFLIVSHDDKVVDVQEKTTSALTVNFDVRLVTGQAYDLAAWADFGDNYYIVEDAVVGAAAPSVKMVLPAEGESLNGSDNKRDAYFAIMNDFSLTESKPISMTLKRPFGLINIKTLDYNEPAVVNTESLPTHYATTITMPTAFSLVSGETMGDAQEVNISAPVLSNWEGGDATGELSYDYIFASNNKELIDFTMNYTKNGAELVSYDFEDIPLQRNYKTNITGNILTKQGSVKIEISQIWDGEYAEQLQVLPTNLQATVDQLPDMEDDKVVLNVASAIENNNLTSNTLLMPQTDKELILIVPGINTSLTIKEADGATYTGKLTLYVTAGTVADIEVNLPNATVEMAQGTYSALTATTAGNTLIIGEDASVETLTVNAGNVKIYGEVESVVKAEGYTGTVTYNIATVAQLKQMAEKLDANPEYYAEKTVVLDNDLDLANENWTAIGGKGKRFSGIFDGNNKTIRNLKIAGMTSDNACGLFGCVSGMVKNFTIDGAVIDHVVDGTNGGIAVVAGSLFPSGQVENVIVKNAVLNGNRQMGGIAGSVYGSIRNCKVENIKLTAVPDQLTGNYDNGDKVGGIVGYSAPDNGGEISGNTAKNVTIKGYRDLGGIAGASKAEKFTNNAVENITVRVDQKTGFYGAEDANAGIILGRIFDGKPLDASNVENGENIVSAVYYVVNGTNLGTLKLASNSTYYIQAGEYDSFGLYTQGKENIALIADGEVIINGKLTFGTHSNYTRSIPESNLIEGFTVKGELFMSACGKFVVRNNTAAQITMKTFGLSEDPSYTSDIEIVGNTVDGSLGNAPQKYAIYIVPNVTGYKLNITGNTIRNVGSHAITIQGGGDGSAKTTPASYTIAENNFESWGIQNGDNRGAVKVWADTAIAPEPMEGGNVSELSVAAKNFVNSVLAGNNIFPNPLRDNCVIFEFYGLPFNSLNE